MGWLETQAVVSPKKASYGPTKYTQKSERGRKIGFEIKKETGGQCQWNIKLIGSLTVLRYIFSPNVESLTWTGGEETHGQT